MDNLIANELAKRYNGTTAYLTVGKKEFGARFRSFNIDGDIATAVVDVLHPHDKGEGTTTKINVDLDKTKIHQIQHNCLFNFGKSFFYYARRPLRQWRKGYYGDNTTLIDVVTSDLNYAGVKVNNMDYANVSIRSVEAFHNPNYANFFEDAINRIKREDLVGVAITPTFGVAISFIKGMEYTLYFKDMPIANISGNKVITSYMKQEVIDFFKYFSRGGFDVS